MLSHVLSYLSIEDLKDVRLVNHLWNQEASKLLKKRSDAIITFNFKKPSLYLDDSTQLYRYIDEMKPCQNQFISSIVLNLNRDYSEDSEDEDDELETGNYTYPENKILLNRLEADLLWFFTLSNNNHVFTKLILDGSIETKHILVIRTRIITLLKDTLKELDMGGWWQPRNEDYSIINEPNPALNEEYQFPSQLEFSSLKSFTLSLYTHLDFQIKGWSWIESLVKSIKDVTCIHLCCCEVVMMEFLELLRKSRHLFNNLNEVEIFMEDSTNFFHFLAAHCDATLPITMLTMHNITADEIPTLQEILWKYCKSLKFLDLWLPTVIKKWTLRFPSFPELKVLDIAFHQDRDPDVETNHEIKCGLLFGNDKQDSSIDYNKYFPVLQQLTLFQHLSRVFKDGPWWTKHQPIFGQFITPLEKNKICTTLKILDIPYTCRDNCQIVICPLMEEIAALFPNVHNKWINQTRNQDNS
jgi:hypothetical protein